MILSALDERGVLLVAIVMAVAAWPIYTRVIRAATSRESEQAHVDAARALGASRSRLLVRHVVPGSLGSVIAVIPPTIAFTIGAEALLSFLGAGLQLPDVSWGSLLAEAQRYIRQAPHLMLPGLFLLVVTGAFVVVGESARSGCRSETGLEVSTFIDLQDRLRRSERATIARWTTMNTRSRAPMMICVHDCSAPMNEMMVLMVPYTKTPTIEPST